MINVNKTDRRGLVRAVKQLRFGFSPGGLFAFVLVMLPNILWMLAPPPNDPLAANSAPAVVDALEHASQWVLVAALVLLVSREKGRRFFLAAAAVLLAGYYGFWTAYYLGFSAPWMLVGMAVFPPLFFCLTALRLKNFIALFPAVVFGVLHTAVTCINYL